jgi:serine/threonine protein kinase
MPVAGSQSARSQPMLSSSTSVDEGRFLPGVVMAGRYRIAGLLGRGGMGEVYRATDLTLGQAVALKFLPEAASSDDRALARFYNEVRMARQVTHPNVCRVYDIGQVDSQHYISMEYVDGEDLATLMRRIGRVPPDKAAEIGRKLCAGLAAAHEKGVLHRDLKPANVMIDGRGNVVIMDFGLAGLTEQLQADVRSGTPAYMAPEQLAGTEVTARSDLYSLGLLLYELFTGKRAYEAASIMDLMEMQERAQPASISTMVKELQPGIEPVIMRCLDHDPRRRPASALAVAAGLGSDALAAALAAGEIPSPELVAAAGETEGLQPKVAIAWLAATLVGIVVVGILGAKYCLLNDVPLENPPDALASDARSLIRSFGYTGKPADSAWAIAYNSGYQTYLRQHPRVAAARWKNPNA